MAVFTSSGRRGEVGVLMLFLVAGVYVLGGMEFRRGLDGVCYYRVWFGVYSGFRVGWGGGDIIDFFYRSFPHMHEWYGLGWAVFGSRRGGGGIFRDEAAYARGLFLLLRTTKSMDVALGGFT